MKRDPRMFKTAITQKLEQHDNRQEYDDQVNAKTFNQS
jgi:hypothetical protein